MGRPRKDSDLNWRNLLTDCCPKCECTLRAMDSTAQCSAWGLPSPYGCTFVISLRRMFELKNALTESTEPEEDKKFEEGWG